MAFWNACVQLRWLLRELSWWQAACALLEQAAERRKRPQSVFCIMYFMHMHSSINHDVFCRVYTHAEHLLCYQELSGSVREHLSWRFELSQASSCMLDI